MRGRPKGPSAEDRLKARTKRDPATGCLVFQGTSKANPYGRIKVDGRSIYAHRLAWELKHGPIPEGMDVLHGCDNPPCCEATNKGHLFLGTHADNMHDRDQKGRQVSFAGEAHARAKLTEDDVRDIRCRYEGGETAASISRDYSAKVSASRIDQILWKKAWAHVK